MRRLTLSVTAVLMVLGALFLLSSPASAVGEDNDTGAGTTSTGGYVYIGPSQWTRSGPGRVDPCSYDVRDYRAIWNFLSGIGGYGGMNLGPVPEEGDPMYDPADWEYEWAFQFCPSEAAGGVSILNNFFQLQPGEIGNHLLPDLLAQLEVDPPDPVFAPPEGQFQVVGVRTWMWIPAGAATDTSVSGCINDLGGAPVACATLTASFEQAVWEMGNGDTEICNDAGEEWYSGAGEQTSCGYVYEDDSDGGTFSVAAETEWTLTWTCTIYGGDCTGNPGPFVGQLFRDGLVADLDVQAWEAQITGTN